MSKTKLEKFEERFTVRAQDAFEEGHDTIDQSDGPNHYTDNDKLFWYWAFDKKTGILYQTTDSWYKSVQTLAWLKGLDE
jgi:hypothetical protein